MEPLQRRYKPLQSCYESLRSRYQSLLVVTEPLPILRAVTELGGSKEPVPYSGILFGPSHPRRVLPLGVFPQRPCHRGTLHGEPPIPTLCGRLREREAGLGPLHWGHYSTPVRILQWGDGITWADGFVLACALLRRRVCFGLRRCPTCPPSNVLGYRGTPPVPPAGAAPPAPCAASVASLRWRIGTLPSLPPGTGTGTVFDCMLLSFSAEFRGFRHGAVVYPSFTRR